MKYDVIIVGAGPAGIFTALEMIKKGSLKRIVIIEKGKSIDERRNAIKASEESCTNLSKITGAGAFSDGKLSLSSEVGGQLPDLIGGVVADETIQYTDQIYLEFGANPEVEGITDESLVREIRRNAIQAGLKLVECPIRYVGTEQLQRIYADMQSYLVDNGVEILFSHSCEDLLVKDNTCIGCIVKDETTNETIEMYGNHVIIASGRSGAAWFENICAKHSINYKAGSVDIGVRVEVRNEIMESVNNVLSEAKLIGYPKPFKNKVRTYCQNPGGFVSDEAYDDNLKVVNGHSSQTQKSENTNLAILCSHNFEEPFNKPIEYARKVGELTNMLGNGKLLVQRYGDILEGKRTWAKELSHSNLKPSMKDAVAGDITSAIPYRTMTNIINFIQAVDKVVPGFASDETLLYSPELKFNSNRIKMDEDFNTNITTTLPL